MDDPSSGVRQALLQRRDIVLTSEQRERALLDPDPDVRAAILTNDIHRLRIPQIDRALEDPSWMVREAAAARADFTPTPEQIESGLTKESTVPGRHVARAFLRRGDILLTETQIQAACVAPWWEVRRTLALRPDFMPTFEQQREGIMDGNPMVADIYKSRLGEWDARRQSMTQAKALAERNGASLDTKVRKTP